MQVRFVGLQNFRELFATEPFILALRNTAVFMGIGILVLFVLALVLSLLLSREKFIAERFTLLTPLIVPMAAVALAWELILGQFPILMENTMISVILMYIWKNIGYMVVIFTSAISVLPMEYREIFYLESNSFFKYCRLIILPLIAPMAFFACLIAVMNSFKIFKEIFVIYSSNPPREIYMLQHFMNNNFYKLNYQRLSAAAFMVVGFVVILIAIYMWAKDTYNEKI